MKSQKNNRDSVLIFSISIVIALLFYLLVPHKLINFNDSDYYRQMLNLLKGDGFTENGTILDRYPPLMPLILAGLTKIALLLQTRFYVLYIAYTILCLAITNLFLFKTARLLINKQLSFLASILFACAPFVLFCIIRVVSEPTYLMFTNIALFLLLREYKSTENNLKIFLVTGFILGLAMLTRPTALFYPLFLFFLFFSLLKNLLRTVYYWLRLFF